MKITFLGTGTSQGIPIIGSDHPVCLSDDSRDKRLRVSILLQWNDFNFVVDCGPDFRQQMLNANCKKLDGILFTHEHADHTAGLDDIRPFYFKQGNIDLYAHERVLNSLKNVLIIYLKLKTNIQGHQVLINISLREYYVRNGSKKIIPINAMHNNLQVFGFRFESFAYLTDIKTMASQEIKKLKNLDILVVNALRIEPHISHFNLQEALDFIKAVNPQRAYLTHISHLLGSIAKLKRLYLITLNWLMII